jgi:molybdopterin/thiamine biosynthesis adenylyltransferase
MTAPRYEDLTARNAGYVDAATQQRIASQRLLIAGCGIGSSLALCATRLGFRNFILADGDTVDVHNLNRQFYDAADVGRLKVEALRDQILRINPSAQVQTVAENLDAGNTDRIVASADIVFDTVDFLDLQAILRLHERAHQQSKPVFTALSVGFGALVWFFPAQGAVTLPMLLTGDISAAGGGDAVYADVFASFVQRIAPHLDPDVVEQIARVLALLKEGKPCPAPQVAVGSFAIGAMATSMIHDMLAGRDVPAAPAFVVHSFRQHRTQIVDISRPAAA